MPNKQGVRNLVTFIPRVFHFVNKGEHLILVLLHEENIENKESVSLIG